MKKTWWEVLTEKRSADDIALIDQLGIIILIIILGTTIP